MKIGGYFFISHFSISSPYFPHIRPIRNDVGESTAELKTATNSTDISITEKSQRLFRITYNAVQATYAAFCSTVKFVISAAGTLAFILKKNENEVIRYEEYFSEGSHTKTYSYPFTSEVGQNTMSLSVVSADGAEGKFPKMHTWGYVMGAYLAGDTPWDGYIEARDDEVCFSMRRTVRKKLVHVSDVCRDKIPENGNNMMLPWTNEEVGHAGIANTNTDTSIGTYNSNESGRIENGKGYRHVWDFASDKANGEIGCICLTTKDGGTNGMHHSYWNLSCGGTDLNSSSVDSFRQAYHTIVGHYISDSQFNCALYKWFYMDRLDNGNVRLLGKHIHNGCVYEVILFNPMSISVSNEKPFCGIISVKKVIELFPASERIPDSMYDNSYHHGSYYYDCNTTSSDYVPQEEKEKLRQNWEDNPQWLAYFPYVIGDKIHIVATSLHHIHHYIYSLSDYSQVSKKTIETDTHLQNYGVGLNYVRVNNSSSSYRWFYGTGVNGDYGVYKGCIADNAGGSR